MTSSNDEVAPYDFSTDPDDITRDDVTGRDFIFNGLLSTILGAKNDNDNSIGVTLAIDGLLVSGTAISATAWKKSLVKGLETINAELASGFDEFVSALFQAHDELIDERGQAERPLPAHTYIHMQDVRIVSGDTSHWVPYWRGQLDKLTGWTLGSYKKD